MVPLPAICLFIGWQWDLEKKMKKGLIICFLGVVLYGGFYFVLHGEKEVRQQNVIDMQNGKISIDDSVNQEKDNGEIKSVWEKIALSKYGGAEFLTMDDVVSNNKIEFRINSVKVTKKFDVAWVCPYESATNFKHDKNMNITEKQSYVAFNMTVNNTKKKKNKQEDFIPLDQAVRRETKETIPSSPAVEIPVDLTKLFLIHNLDTMSKISNVLDGYYHGDNTLFRDSQTHLFYLVVHKSSHTPEEFNKVCNILSEYSTQINFSDSIEAYFNEHFDCIIRSRALQQFAAI